VTAPLRITIVAPGTVVGGAELWLLRLLDATGRVAADAVLLGHGPLRGELERRGVVVEVLATGRRGRDVARSAVALSRLLRRRPDRPDLVLANGVKAAAVSAPAARAVGLRCVWVKHDHSFDRRLGRLLRWCTDGVVATSDTLSAATPGEAPVVPPPRPDRPLARADARAELARYGVDPADGRPVLGLVGRLVPYKGFEDAVRALARPGGGGWRVAVLGDDDPSAPGELQRLRRVARQEGVADRVAFAGPVPSAGRLLAGVDAVAVLTRAAGPGPSREGFGAVALEAMACGVPVVATSAGPVAALLRGGAGVVVPPAAPAAVAAALGRLSEPGSRRDRGAVGLAAAAGHPGAEECADRLLTILAETACRPGAGLTAQPPASVVVTVLDEAAAVDRLLDAVVPQLGVPGDEVVIVDGGSTDGTVERVAARAARDGRVRLVSVPGAGISAGRNAGVRAAANDLLVCTDAGCDPSPGWVAAFRRAAADRPEALLTGVYRVPASGVLGAAFAAVGYPDPRELRHPTLLVRAYGRLFGRVFDPRMPTGRSVAFPRQAWQAAGGFPEHLPTGEDVVFGQAVAATGRPAVLVADAEVAWRQRPTVRATARMYARYGEGSGRSRNPRLLGRDVARLAAYGATLVLAGRGTGARVAVAAGWTAYLSLPAVRASRSGWQAVAAVPVAAAVRDLAKAGGAVRGLLAGPARERR
jgi:glycosyltransferase involved in cell wall biosynthesis